MAKAQLFYFPAQGRAEAIRFALALAGVDWELVAPEGFKSNPDAYPFAQSPRYVDGEVDLVQSQAILRHIARKHGLYGTSEAEHSRVDEVQEGAADAFNQFASKLRAAYQNEDKEAGALAKEAYWQAHVNPESSASPDTRGAHLAFLSRLLERSTSGFFVESGPTIADVVVAVGIEYHVLVFGRERLQKQWPDLVAHLDRVHQLPAIATYLKSPQRLPIVTPWLKTE